MYERAYFFITKIDLPGLYGIIIAPNKDKGVIKMQKTDSVFRKIMTWFLYVNPVLDVISGLYITLYQMQGTKFSLLKTPVTPSLIIRLAMLLFFLVYLIVKRDKKAWRVLIPMGVCCAVTVALEFLFAEKFSLYFEAQYLAKFAFNVVLLLAYLAFFREFESKEKIFSFFDKVIEYTLFILTAVLLICYAFRFGYSTYGDRFGFFGFRGIYYSGNDITGVFMILLPLAFKIALSSETIRGKNILKIIIPAMTVNCLLIIGTKTAFIACAAATVAAFLWSLGALIFKKDKKIFLRMLLILAVIGVLFGALYLISGAGVTKVIVQSIEHTGQHISESQGDVTKVIFSGRQYKLKTAAEQYKASGIKGWLFGIGRGTQDAVIEMDVFEVLFYYGIFGAIAMLWLYVKFGLSFLISFFKKIDLTGACLFVSIGMTTAYLVMAGHILFSTTSGGYFALILLYTKMWYTEKPNQLKI